MAWSHQWQLAFANRAEAKDVERAKRDETHALLELIDARAQQQFPLGEPLGTLLGDAFRAMALADSADALEKAAELCKVLRGWIPPLAPVTAGKAPSRASPFGLVAKTWGGLVSRVRNASGSPSCSFCGKKQEEVLELIRRPGVSASRRPSGSSRVDAHGKPLGGARAEQRPPTQKLGSTP
jgi:hypothetical protein